MSNLISTGQMGNFIIRPVLSLVKFESPAFCQCTKCTLIQVEGVAYQG